MSELLLTMERKVEVFVLGTLAFSMLVAMVEFFVEWRLKKLNRWRLGEMWASFSVFLVAKLTERAGTLVYAVTLIYVAELVPWEIPVNGWSMLGAVVAVDFLYYWEHRWEHEVRLLWGYHSIHHSSPIYNYTTALRVSFIDSFTTWVFFVPAVLLGFNPYQVLLAVTVMLMYQVWVHTELIGKLGFLERIFMTPSLHRVHHGSDALYLDKNYGGIFSVWDQLFGSYQVETHRPTYGLTTPIDTIHVVKIHTHEFAQIVRDVWRAQSWSDAWRFAFGHPGWHPDAVAPSSTEASDG